MMSGARCIARRGPAHGLSIGETLTEAHGLACGLLSYGTSLTQNDAINFHISAKEFIPCWIQQFRSHGTTMAPC